MSVILWILTRCKQGQCGQMKTVISEPLHVEAGNEFWNCALLYMC